MKGCWEQRREGAGLSADLSQLHAWMLKFILAVTRQRGDTSQPAGVGAYTYARETSTQTQAHTHAIHINIPIGPPGLGGSISVHL